MQRERPPHRAVLSGSPSGTSDVTGVVDQASGELTHGMRLSVVIPTTHRVAAVRDLVGQIRATTPVATSVTVVDNGPNAAQEDWETFGGELIVRDEFLGSEQAFALGLSHAPEADWYLLLDHDARLSDDSLSTLLGSASDRDAVYSANQDGEGISWDRRNGRTPGPRDLSPALIPVQFRAMVRTTAQPKCGKDHRFDEFRLLLLLGRLFGVLGAPACRTPYLGCTGGCCRQRASPQGLAEPLAGVLQRVEPHPLPPSDGFGRPDRTHFGSGERSRDGIVWGAAGRADAGHRPRHFRWSGRSPGPSYAADVR